MKIHGDTKPTESFVIHEMPDKPNFVMIRFFENAEEIVDKIVNEDGKKEKVKSWVWDEWHLEQFNTGDMQTDVTNNFEMFLQAARKSSGWISPEEQILTELDRLDLKSIRPLVTIENARLSEEEIAPEDVERLKEIEEAKEELRERLHELQSDDTP